MTAEPRFDALVVDFGGVLTTPLQTAMVAFAQEMGIEMQHLVRAALGGYMGGEDALVFDFETGKISEEEFCTEFARRLGEYSGTPVDPSGLVTRMFSELALEESMFAAVESARRAGLKTGLLSNSWGTGLYPHDRLADAFDVSVISGEVGLRKPDPAIFELTTARLGVAAERCVFVDDHPGHLASAAEAGMTTVLHREPARTIEELEALLGVPLRAPAEGG
ncbi:MAG: HAD family phosphatase [Actinomycetota bacterium]|nr:HAD family phosphatase [Actinomycetota bacterium]